MAQDPKELAKQLRKPEGEVGVQVANRLNTSNIHITSYVYDSMGVKNGDKILEIGFGNGKLMPGLFDRAPDISLSGIDFSETMVKEATMYLKDYIDRKTLEIKPGATSFIPYGNDVFDKVCTINTLYFWENPIQDAREVLRVLKPGGKIYVGIRPKEEAQRMEMTKYGFTLYDPEEAVELFEKAGFTDVHVILQKDAPIQFDDKEHVFTSCCVIGKKP